MNSENYSTGHGFVHKASEGQSLGQWEAP